MPSTDSPIVIDGRMIAQDQCHGIARVTIEFVRNLPAVREREVVLLMADGAGNRFDVSDLSGSVRIERTTSKIGKPYQVRDLNRVLRRIGAGVFFSPYHALAPLHVPCPLVVGLHDCIFESDRRLAGTPARAVAYRANTLRTLRQAVAAVVPSHATAADIPAHYASAPPAVVCPNGVDAQFWQADAEQVEAVRARRGLPERYVLHVGARRLHKNQSVLVRALGSLDPDVKLVLLGHRDPRIVDPLDQLAKDLGVENRIICVDDVSDAEMPGLYGGASVFAFPSVMEGFGLPPLEAMAAGVPVVASAIPVVAEVCRDAALLVSPFGATDWAEAIQRVLDSATLRSRLVEKGSKIAAEASWQPGALGLYRTLDRVASGAGPG